MSKQTLSLNNGTVADLAKAHEVASPVMGNALTVLEKLGMASKKGFADRPEGSRGRNAPIWHINAPVLTKVNQGVQGKQGKQGKAGR